MAITIGGKNGGNTRAERTITAPSNVINLSSEEDEQSLCLVETVSDLDEMTYDAVGATRGTPAYTENFASLFGSDLYGTAYKTQEGSAQLTDVWGSYLENGGTVNFKKVEGTENTYSYDYSKGQKTNLQWPEDGKLLFFFQAPYEVTSELTPRFYADGSIQFDYADPNTPDEDDVITDGAVNQTDILFTSKNTTEAEKDKNHILLYHALASVKFKMGTYDDGGDKVVTVTKVQLKNVLSEGVCTIKPNYEDDVNTADGNKSNKTGADATKSFKCSTWSGQSVPVTYEQNLPEELYDGTDDEDGVDFPENFYDNQTAVKNYNDGTFSQTLQLVPQETKDIEVYIYYTCTVNGNTTEEHCVKTSLSKFTQWEAGKLYTYALSANELAVDVSDNWAYNESQNTYTKNNLATTNTANTIQYQRVALVANWYKVEPETNEPLIVKTEFIKGTTVSSYVSLTDFLGTGWGAGDDGYYYYKYPVKPGQAPNVPLFGTYTLNRTNAGVSDDMELEMQVIVQAVRYDSKKEDKLTSVKQSWTSVKIGSTDLDSWLSTDPETPSSN